MNTSVNTIDTAAFFSMLHDCRPHFDYILLDAPAGVDAGFRLAAAHADRCLLVTGPSPAAIRDAEHTGQLLELMGKENIRLIVNRISKKIVSATDLTVDDVMDMAGLPLLGIVPEDIHVTLAASFGRPLLKYKPRSAAARACKRIANRIQGIPDPIKLR